VPCRLVYELSTLMSHRVTATPIGDLDWLRRFFLTSSCHFADTTSKGVRWVYRPWRLLLRRLGRAYIRNSSEDTFVLLQRIMQKISEDPRVLRTHIDAAVNATFFLSEFQEELECVVTDLKEVRITRFFPRPNVRDSVLCVFIVHRLYDCNTSDLFWVLLSASIGPLTRAAFRRCFEIQVKTSQRGLIEA